MNIGAELASKRVVVESICAVCGKPIRGLKTRQYCEGNACRQKAKRNRPLYSPCTVEMFDEADGDLQFKEGDVHIKMETTNDKVWYRWRDVCCVEQFGSYEIALRRFKELCERPRPA